MTRGDGLDQGLTLLGAARTVQGAEGLQCRDVHGGEGRLWGETGEMACTRAPVELGLKAIALGFQPAPPHSHTALAGTRKMGWPFDFRGCVAGQLHCLFPPFLHGIRVAQRGQSRSTIQSTAAGALEQEALES